MSSPYQIVGLSSVAVRDGGGDRVDEGGSSINDWDRMLGELAAQPIGEGWVTLEEAAGATGVSRSTLRSWYRSGLIPSKMVAGSHGPQRIVPLDLVVDRALGSSRSRRQLEQARSLQAEVEELRRRIERIERQLGPFSAP
jgi:transposase